MRSARRSVEEKRVPSIGTEKVVTRDSHLNASTNYPEKSHTCQFLARSQACLRV